MAFEKWKDENGGWCDSVVAVVACLGVLLLFGLYYVFSNNLDTKIAESWKVPAPPQAETTGSATR